MRGKRVIFLGVGGMEKGLRGMRQLARLLQEQNGGWGMTHFTGAFAPLRSDGEYKEFAFADLWDVADMRECLDMTWEGLLGAPMRVDEAREKAGMAFNGGTNDAGVKRSAANVYAGSGGAWQQGSVTKEEMRMIMRSESEGVMKQFQHLAEKEWVQKQVQLGVRAEREFLVDVAAEGCTRSMEECRHLLHDLDVTVTRICDFVCVHMGIDLGDKRTAPAQRKRAHAEVNAHGWMEVAGFNSGLTVTTCPTAECYASVGLL
jgi:hypothetical protein